MPETTCDRRALEIARAIHEAESPTATILFGSRARGDFDELRSDIDIMLVDSRIPDEDRRQSVDDWVSRLAAGVYGFEIPVQTLWILYDEFQEKRRYVNHVVSHALKDGAIMSANPMDFILPNDDGGNVEYDWTDYENRLQDAEGHLGMFQLGDDHSRGDRMVSQRAHSALEHALKALIAAHGAVYPSTHDLGALIGTIRRIDSKFENFALSIDPAIYSDYAGRFEYLDARRHPRLTDQPEYRERTVRDVRNIIDLAIEARGERNGNADSDTEPSRLPN